MSGNKKRGILERLNAGEVVIGDGGFLYCMERRGFVKAGAWTPEANVEHPEAVRQLHSEFLRAGADVMQTFTFYASEDKLENRGHTAGKIGCEAINQAACDLAKEVASKGDALVAGNISQVPSYLAGLGKEAVQREFKKQIDIFVKNDVDFLIGEEVSGGIYMDSFVVEPILALPDHGQTMTEESWLSDHICTDLLLPRYIGLNKPISSADIVGVNCCYDPSICLEVMREMKAALEKEGLERHLIVQPVAYHTPELKYDRIGLSGLPEFPLALESRLISRWDVQKYAREAYDMGIRYIGACCGFEPYHIRAIAEELAKERGKLPPASEKHGMWGDALRQHTYPWVRARARRSHWENLNPASGRPLSAAYAKLDRQWDLQPGHKDLSQDKALTSDEELKELAARSQEA